VVAILFESKLRKMVKDAILEIGSEEIPAGYLEQAREDLYGVAEKIFAEKRLKYKKIHTYATPRRLVLYCEQMAEKQTDLIREIIGPPVNVAFDVTGQPMLAATGFAQSYGLRVEELARKKTNKGEYLCVRIHEEGEETAKILSEFFPQVIAGLSFPKAMVWEETKVRFARPIRNLLALYGSTVIKFTFAGIRSGKNSNALFPLSRKKITIPQANRYFTLLRNLYVLIDQKERQEVIRKLLQQIVKKTGGEVYLDDALLNEVTYLVEYPSAVLGKFPAKFLNLPREVLITCLIRKGKFFPVVDKNGELLPHFIGIRNGISEHQDIVQEGYERVIMARLNDAEFFFNQDRKTSLESKVSELKKIIFQEPLGTIYDKVVRVDKLAEYVYSQIPESEKISLSEVKRVVLLAKADMVTDMVKEYPELEGVMGRIYALANGEKEIVAYGIEQHHWPLSSDGKIPETAESALVSLADKLDTIVSDFVLGLIPTGSTDPYGLRRQAGGILRILKENNWSTSLDDLIERAWTFLPIEMQKNCDKSTILNNLLSFFRSRLETLLSEKNITYDEINAVLVVGFADIPATFSRAEALDKIRQVPDCEPLVIAYKRAANILKQAEKLGHSIKGLKVNEKLLEETAEKELWQKFVQICEEGKLLLENKKYYEFLQLMVSLRPVIDSFFEQVLVMCENEELQLNRLVLLNEIVKLFLNIADFSCLVEKGSVG